jgi:microsomal epoxide hydrolase
MAVGNSEVHFMALFSSKPDAIPIVLLHGWPGSFTEFNGVLDILKDRYTPDTLPYHVVVPSLPGWGFSSKPPQDRDFGSVDMGEIINGLMVNLGFGSGYAAQGGDIGSYVARRLAVTYDACKAVHCRVPIPFIGDPAG